MIRFAVAAALGLALGGCVGLGGKPPPSLLTLTPAATVAGGDTRSSANARTIVVGVPATSQALATTRLAVSDGATEIAYVKNAVWAEAPARLFQRLLSETLAARSPYIVLDPRQAVPSPSTRIEGQLVRFGIDGRSGDAVIVYDAMIVGGGETRTRRFEAREPAGAIEAAPAASALNKAANRIAGEFASWVTG